MILLFSALTFQGETRVFSLIIEDIDACLNLLNTAVFNGEILLWAEIIDTPDGRIQLPTEAFDGYSIKKELKALKAEWERILP